MRKELIAFPKSYATGTPGESLLKFEAIATTSMKDRDQDILKSGGATLDSRAPLLWAHRPELVIGKVMGKVKHTKDELRVSCSIIDFGPDSGELGALARDAVVLVKNNALACSIGFEPTEYEAMDEPDSRYLVKKFEILELSLVSVPSNRQALITSIDKLHSPFVKGYASAFRHVDPLPPVARPVPTFTQADVQRWLDSQDDVPAEKAADEFELLGICAELGMSNQEACEALGWN